MDPRCPDVTIVTFDVDWAPDWCTTLCMDICRKARIPATFFLTHQSPIVDDLRKDPLFEVGAHPNFLPGSTQGDSVEDVIAFCRRLAPEAISIRTHGLVQSSPLFATLGELWPEIRADVSLLLFGHPGLRPTSAFYDGRRRGLVRLPFFWEDDDAAIWPTWHWSREPYSSAGLRIYDFHPIHVALNTATMDQYAALRKATADVPFSSLAYADVKPFINPEAGTRTFLEAVVGRASQERFSTVARIATAYFEERERCA